MIPFLYFFTTKRRELQSGQQNATSKHFFFMIGYMQQPRTQHLIDRKERKKSKDHLAFNNTI